MAKGGGGGRPKPGGGGKGKPGGGVGRPPMAESTAMTDRLDAVVEAIAPEIWRRLMGNMLSHQTHEDEMRRWAADGHIRPGLETVAKVALAAADKARWRPMSEAPVSPPELPQSGLIYRFALDADGGVFVFRFDQAAQAWGRWLALPP